MLQPKIKNKIENVRGCILTRTDNWETPQFIFEHIEKEYLKGKFSIDLCADLENSKCTKFIDESLNLFAINPYFFQNETAAFMNPPYRKKSKSTRYAFSDFMIYAESVRRKSNIDVACLVSANITSSETFQDLVGETEFDRQLNYNEIHFIPKRVKFLNESKQIEKNPSFSSMVIIFRGTK